MGVDEGNLQVKDVDVILENLSNNYSGTYLQVAVMVFIIQTISYICDSRSYSCQLKIDCFKEDE